MSLDPLSSAFEFASKAIDKIFPDKDAANAAKLKLVEMQQSGELAQLASETDLLKGQQEINKIEAASTSLFKSGWRPAVGWVGVISLALVYWPKAVTLTYVWSYQCMYMIHHTTDMAKLILPAFPDLGTTDLMGLLCSILGIGVMRTVEKAKGVAAS